MPNEKYSILSKIIKDSILLLLFISFFFPSSLTFADTTDLSTTFLQGPILDLYSQKRTIWQGDMSIKTIDPTNVVLDNVKDIPVIDGPARVLLLPFSSQELTQLNSNQESVLQGTSSVSFQGSSATNSISSLLTKNTIDTSLLTVPAVSSQGKIVVDNATQTLSNKTISGLVNTITNIPNSALAHSAINILGGNGISISTSDPIDLGSTITIASNALSSLNNQTGAVNIAVGGINQIATNSGVLTITGTEVDTLSSVTDRGAITDAAVTLSNTANSITAGTLTAKGGTIDNVIIGATSPATGSFTSVNGLNILNNGSNALNIAAGKTFAVGNSVTLAGTDGTTLTLPGITDTLVGKNTTDVLTNKTISASTNTITGLSIANFSSDLVSDLSSIGGFLTATGTATLTNKTIAASSNTISGLTNSNLSGGAGITNANLANPSITINSGTGLSGGTTVALGDTLTLTNTGVTSLTGTTNQVLASGSTGGIILSLPQSIGTSSSPSFSSLSLTNTTNQLLFGTTNIGTLSWLPSASRTVTLPDVTDTLIGKTTTDVLTNKTISAGSNTISALTTSNFSSANISQWTNNLGFITPSTTDTLTNKTIAAGSNTISGLTNTNLSGTAGISNANLANSSITVNTGTGLSGGTAVSLGGSLSLTNIGVTSLAGTSNQVIASGSTGGVTLSLPQSVGTGSSPAFATLSLTNTSNQLALGTTNIGTISWLPTTTRTLTLPDVTDTLIGKTTTDVLTNKTLTAPAINGTVTTTGLTLPAHTVAGTITGSGSPTITNFGAINGLTLTAASDGLTLAGGTTSRTLTLSGADITVGSTIRPTSAGTLTVQSNGANTLVLDTGGSATISLGATNATQLGFGNTSSTLNLSGNFDQSSSSGTFKTSTGSASLNGDTTVASGKVLAVTSADKLTVGGTIIPQTIPIPVPLTATIVTQPVFIADTTYQVVGAKCIPGGVSISGTFQVTVESGTTAAGSGTSQLTGTISLSGTLNTVVSGTLIGSPTTINAGDRVSAKFGGVLTGLLGTCTIYIKRV